MLRMTSISISSGVSAVSSSGGQAQGSDNTIAGLRQKLVALNKDLRDALSEPTEAGMQKAKAIQMKIQITQAKLEQMMRQEAENARTKQDQPPKNTAAIHQRSQSGIDIYV
jgi:phage-related minor tail protein